MANSRTKSVLLARTVALAAAMLGVAFGPGGVATATAHPANAGATVTSDDGRPYGPYVVACDDDPSDPGDPGDDGDDGDGD